MSISMFNFNFKLGFVLIAPMWGILLLLFFGIWAGWVNCDRIYIDVAEEEKKTRREGEGEGVRKLEHLVGKN